MLRLILIALLLAGGGSPVLAQTAPAQVTAETALVTAARGQVGVTTQYDPAYTRLDFPGGDVPVQRGVCTDVVIRALRESAGIDLQLAVNRDMKARFASYPKNWGLKRPDANIDHRRVPNLIAFLDHLGARISGDYLPGDIVTSVLPGNLPHVMIVSDRPAPSGRPLVIHNIGRGAREEDMLTAYSETGHFRLTPDVRARLAKLGR